MSSPIDADNGLPAADPAAQDAQGERFGIFDFGLSHVEEERAGRLHAEAVIVDTLCQGPCGRRSFTPAMIARLQGEYEQHRNAQRAVLDTWSLPNRLALADSFPDLRRVWEASGLTGASRQTIGFQSTPDADAYVETMPWFALHQAQFDRFDWLDKALNADDFFRAKRSGKRVGFLNTQNTLDLGTNVDRIDQFHMFGMRMIQLTYNTVNFVGGGCMDRADCGVTSFGAEVIGRMNACGIIIDVSHCGDATTFDACKLSRDPVVISHTGARALLENPRNNSDDTLKAVADTGGYVGIFCVPQFLTDDAEPTIRHFLDHVEHVANLIGVEHVGIGTDWPLQSPDWGMARLRDWLYGLGFSSSDGFDAPSTLRGFDDYRDLPNITRGLVARGFSDRAVKGILGENFLRVFRQVCG
ncbi:dipeptidase [Hoeflea poritis]|uniref:Membrane dipeptidase n=1 Tax=Hoeflea poritis TaxID=2993659 RepID=A0ABT4VT15_9HYPH|nr:membrane dipeptidase [Hoeflea poritis]MDA4847857.1 membrane dipeptidase [Hoeflea poritis]